MQNVKNDLGVDAISRAEVLKIFDEWFATCDIADRKASPKAKINALPSVTLQEPRWIPVNERLPKAGEYIGDVERYYLVQNEYGDMLVARYTHSEYWEQIYQLNPIGDEIVAWMPLPVPFEPQESEDKE